MPWLHIKVNSCGIAVSLLYFHTLLTPTQSHYHLTALLLLQLPRHNKGCVHTHNSRTLLVWKWSVMYHIIYFFLTKSYLSQKHHNIYRYLYNIMLWHGFSLIHLKRIISLLCASFCMYLSKEKEKKNVSFFFQFWFCFQRWPVTHSSSRGNGTTTKNRREKPESPTKFNNMIN